MPYPNLILVNEFGEQSNNLVLGGDADLTTPIAAGTVLANITGGSAIPTGVTYAALSAVLLPTMLLTGFTSGAGTLIATDTVLQAIQKLSGNTQNLAVINNVLTGYVVGADAAVAATDTVMQAIAKLQGQIDALP